MKREDAINYLQRKSEIRRSERVDPEFTAEEKEKIKTVMKEGKIYGDPLADIQW